MGSSSAFTIETGVDKLVRFLRGKGSIPVSEAAQEIGVTTKVIEQWATFLMEEKIIGIDYKFTTPYIHLIETDLDEDILNYKKKFKKEVSKDGSDDHVEYHWKNHILEILDKKKEFFFREATKRGLKNINQIWNEYKAKVTNL